MCVCVRACVRACVRVCMCEHAVCGCTACLGVSVCHCGHAPVRH